MRFTLFASLSLFAAAASALVVPSEQSPALVERDDLTERAGGFVVCRAGLISYYEKCVYPGKCPFGTFGNLDTQRCQQCNIRFPGAETCIASRATTCKSPYYLRLGECVRTCPAKTVVMKGTRICVACTTLFSYSTSCTPTRATACRAPRILENGRCVVAPSLQATDLDERDIADEEELTARALEVEYLDVE